MSTAPVSIRLPEDLTARARRYARARRVGLATALRSLLSAQLDEIEQDEQLSRSERWQRDQAWASAQDIFSGKAKPVPWSELDRIHERALAKLRSRQRAG